MGRETGLRRILTNKEHKPRSVELKVGLWSLENMYEFQN